MNSWIRAEYDRLRKAGWPASDALRAARTKDAFDDLENEGIVKLEAEIDPEGHDPSYVDTWTDRPQAWRDRTKKEISERASSEGTWGIVAYARASEDAVWEEVYSCWDFVGTDWKDSGYDVDARLAAVEYHAKLGAAS